MNARPGYGGVNLTVAIMQHVIVASYIAGSATCVLAMVVVVDWHGDSSGSKRRCNRSSRGARRPAATTG